MNIRRLVLIISALVAAALVVSYLLVEHWQQSEPEFRNAPKLTAAVDAYTRQLKQQGQPLPETVTLQELLRLNFLSDHDVQAFAGMEVTFSLLASNAAPQAVLVRVRLPDGTQIVTRNDGSVEQLSK